MDSKISAGISQGRNEPESSLRSEFGQEANDSQEERKLRAELKRLLGPLVPTLLRDAGGALDLSRMPAKSFDEFKQFLSAQAALNDGKSFRNPYQKMLAGEDFRSLLGLLYQEKDPAHFVSISGEEGQRQLDDLTAALIEIDADAFVQRQLNTREGLGRLRHVLGKMETFTGDHRADVAKALGRARDHTEDQLYSYCIDQEISLWNFFNLGVNETEVARVSELAVKLIEGLEDRLPVVDSKFEALSSVEPAQVEKFKKIEKEKAGDPNPVSQAQVALAELWLLTANQKLWSLQNEYGGYDDRAHALEQIERLFDSSEGIQDEDGFRAFNEELQNFIEGAITTEADDTAAWANYRILGIGMEQVYDNVDPVQRGPYQKLQRLSSEWKYAGESGHTILSHLQANASEDGALRDGANRLILNLKETQRQLWHGYMQHKAISRFGSDLAQIPYLIAKGVGAENPADYALGDNAQIDAANQEIGRIIENLGKAKTPEALGQEIEKLHELLKPGSLLYTAYEAAEMDGTEQILGLAQTVAIIAATAAATRGGSVVAGTGVVAARSVATASWLDKVVKGFAWGAYIATAENAVAAGTGEVREGGETADKWVKDAVATGTATAMTGPWMEAAAGTASEQGMVRNLFYRYTSNGLQGVKHLGGDIVIETGEEVTDQIFRQGLDGKTLAPNLAELEEITKITVAGGGTKIGALAQTMRSVSPLVPTVAHSETKHPPSTLALQSPLLAPMWTMLGAGGIGGPYRDPNFSRPALSAFELIMFDSRSPIAERLAAIESFQQDLQGAKDLHVYEGISTLLELAADPNVSLPTQILQYPTNLRTDRRQIRLAALNAVVELSRSAGDKIYQIEPHVPGQAHAIVAKWKSTLYQFLSAARADLELDLLEPGTPPFLLDLNRPLRVAFLTALRHLGLQEDSEFLELKAEKYWEPGLARWSKLLLPSTTALLAGGAYLHSAALALSSFLPIMLFMTAWAAASLRKSRLGKILQVEEESPVLKLLRDLKERSLPDTKSPEIRIQEFGLIESKAPAVIENKTEAEAEAELEAADESKKTQNILSLALASGGSGLATLLSPDIAEATVSFPMPVDNSAFSIAALASAVASLGVLGSIFLRLRHMLSYQGAGFRLDTALRARDQAIQANPRIAELHKGLHTPDARLRMLAVEQAAINEFRELTADLVSLLHDPEPMVREAAQAALSQVATEEEIAGIQKQREAEIEELRGWFHDPGARLRELAASLAWIYRDRSLIPDLLGMADDPDPKISNGVIGSIALLANASDLPALILILKSKPSPGLEDSLRSLISYIVRRSPVSDLEEYFRDVDPFVRGNMIHAAMTRSDLEALPLLVKSLQDPDPQIRIAAIEALKILGGPELLPELKKRLADPSPLVRFEANIAVKVLSLEENGHPTPFPKPRGPRDLN